jgi:hypothetical protein
MGIYEGIKTEKKGLEQLKFHISCLDWHERALPRAVGCCYDFVIDQQFTYLLTHVPSQRAQVFQVFEEWRIKDPHTKDDPAKILIDLPDGLVFQKPHLRRQHASTGSTRSGACQGDD